MRTCMEDKNIFVGNLLDTDKNIDITLPNSPHTHINNNNNNKEN